ncbi:hypothetical protein PoB_000032100 [Plakobranchus ocellatus]|uniref:Uncharacterized protein n=1 Tax=Plakobranchus ocellatus TaxID=259542 RepID=A0AAV3XRV2_9GAST|nr:hypothetical protein PoB_000032100 [Plakobranchus ocellatus]
MASTSEIIRMRQELDFKKSKFTGLLGERTCRNPRKTEDGKKRQGCRKRRETETNGKRRKRNRIRNGRKRATNKNRVSEVRSRAEIAKTAKPKDEPQSTTKALLSKLPKQGERVGA